MGRLRLAVVALVVCLAICSVSPALSAVIRVKWNSTYDGPGTDWDHAYHSVQAGLNASVSGDEVWVAGDAAHPYVEWITLKKGVGLYGGFAGTETSRDQRDRQANVTVLDGNKRDSVVTSPSGATATTAIDGFTIRNGGGTWVDSYRYGGGIYCSSSSPSISNNTITANTATGGGGIYCSSSSPSISNNTIAANTADQGGGIYCLSSSPSISNNTITANAVSDYSDNGRGGGIYCYSSSPAISNNTISTNTADFGGGIYCDSSSSPAISSNLITANAAELYSSVEGGGIYCRNSSPMISNNTISANSDSGIYCDGSSPAISGNTISTNGGSGIYCDHSSSTISNNEITANKSGGIRCSSSALSISCNTISANTGAGISCSSSPSPSISSNTIKANTGTGIGCSSSSPSILSNTIAANTASYGGGIYCYSSSPTISNNTITTNTAYDGGAISCESSSSPSISNNAITNNNALYGGGVYCSDSSPTISGNTITANTARKDNSSAYGGGIYCSNSSPTISNNTISANTARNGGGGVYGSNSSPKIFNNMISANSANTGGGVSCTGSPAIFNNLISANSGGGIYASGSPAISNNTITTNSVVYDGGGIYIEYGSGSATISNNIVAFNSSGVCGTNTTVLKNNCVYNPGGSNYVGLSAGATDTQADPKLAAVKYGQFHIQPVSPCRDAGDDTVVQPGWIDIDGQARIQGAHVDIGADESDGTTWTFTPVVVRVSPSGNDDNDGSSWALSKRTVQAGANAAGARGGDVWVAAGTYNERITLPPYTYLYGGFAGTESSRAERNWGAHAVVLDGGGTDSVIRLTPGYAVCSIDGFTIRNGNANYGGGIDCYGYAPTISNNTITANTATCGGGIYCSGGSPTISNNVITANTATDPYMNGGGGICCENSSPAILNNTITANSAIRGGGICSANNSSLAISNNVIAFNSSGILCTSGHPILKSNCVYNPDGYDYYGLSADASDIRTDPKLVAVQYGQVHVQPNSPCRDAGNDTIVQPGWLDMDGQTRIQGTHVDIGADESDGTNWTFTPVTVRVSPSGNDSNDGSSWALAKRTVQAGANAASDEGGEVWVAGGQYDERIVLPAYAYLYGGFVGTETSRNQRNWTANPAVLDGGRSGSVVVAQTGHSITVSGIDGFTIRNGSAAYGGGIYCSNAAPTISNNIVSASTATYGGGIYCSYSSPTISNNTVSANTASYYGGGIYCSYSSPPISNNAIATNTARYGGGGIFCSSSSPAISNNAVSANTAGSGGGMCCDSSSLPTISNNAIAANSASDGGGIYCYSSSPTISSNTISANIASNRGGGIYCSGSPVVSNNTITANTATTEGGGMYCYNSWSKISNNIVAFNSSGICNYSSSPVLRNNCVYNPSGTNYSGLAAGTGDISVDPMLTGDYHLLAGSPCINAGWNAAAGLTTFDRDGEPRLNGVIDIGSDKYWLNFQGAKLAADGSGVCTDGAIVSAVFTDYFYIESDNRTRGIRVNQAGHALSAGMRVHVIGVMSTNSDSERCIESSDTYNCSPPNNSGSVAPLALPNRSLGGGPFGLQGGVWGWVLTYDPSGVPHRTWQQVTGLNNIGLLVRTCGKVVEIDSASPATWFKIDDGSGVNVKCLVPSGVAINPGWSYVAVTGISSCEMVGTELHSLLRVRTQSDILSY